MANKKHKKVLIKKKPVKNKKPKAEVLQLPEEPLFKAKIKVVGIGGGGGSIVSEIGRSLEKASFLIADTDTRTLKKKSPAKPFIFGEAITHGMGTGVNVDLARKAAESAREKIAGILKGHDIIIFIASLGGGLGSGATQVFADVARESGAITFGIFTLPFKFEGKNKYNIAQSALKSLRETLNVSFVIPNEKIFKVISENTAITEAFSVVNKSLIESLESLIDLIFSPGIINIDFADLKAILRGVGNSAFLNTIEESGKNRVEKICEKIFRNPLAQNSGFRAEKILFNIAGSEALSMLEVEKISRHVAEANPDAKIIFGISKNPKLKNKIKVTILTAGGGKSELAAKKPAVIEEKKEEKPAEVSVKAELPDSKPKAKKPPQKKKPSKPKIKKPKAALPVFEPQRLPVPAPVLEPAPVRQAVVRRSGLEIKEAEQAAEKKRIEQEKEWEIPAFLRRVKFKS